MSDSTVIVSIIGAIATVLAALLATSFKQRLRAREKARLRAEEVWLRSQEDEERLRRKEQELAYEDDEAPNSGKPSSVVYGVYFRMEHECMVILVDLSLCNLRGVPCVVAAYFSDSTGQPLIDMDGVYRSYAGHVAVSASVCAKRREELFRGLEMSIPYAQLHLPPGLHDIKFFIRVVREATNETLNSTGEYSWSIEQQSN